MFFNSWPAVEHSAVLAVTGFFVLIAIIRIFGNRTLSRMNAFDFIVSVTLGSLLARAILAPANSLAQLVVAVLVLVLLQWLVSMIGARSHAFYALVTPPPRTLYEDGRFNEDVMKRSGVGTDEIHAAIREAGLHEVSEADRIVLETQGQLSVVWRPRASSWSPAKQR